MNTIEAAQRWMDSPRGRLMLRHESAQLDRVLPRLFGRTLLQLGLWGENLLRGASHFRTGVIGSGPGAQVICDLEALPVVKHSVDTILLAHSLEFASSPHQLLREANRALSVRGQLLILGFNPYSWWGLRHRLAPQYPALPAPARPLSSGRVADWLRLLDYDVLSCERFGPGLRTQIRWLGPMLQPFAPGYLIHARKRRIPWRLTPTPRWQREGPPASATIARMPAARSGS